MNFSSGSLSEFDFQLRDLRILVGEDDEGIRGSLEFLFDTLGAGVVFAENGLHCIEMASIIEFDLVLLDLHLPRWNAEAVLRVLKRTQANIPVIALSSDSDSDMRDYYLGLGFNDYIIKPFDLTEFMESIRRSLPSQNLKRHSLVSFKKNEQRQFFI
jgi:DNA-binding response OmpR family regulator